MNSPVSYRAPRSWRRIGKYLFPVGLELGWRFTKPPHTQVRVAELAAEHPDSVALHTAGNAEKLAEYSYECHTANEHETCLLPAKFVAPAFVVELENGSSYGRHCCAIGPAGKAVRETGFNLDGEVLTARSPISRLRLQYWRKRWEGDVTSRPWLPPKQRIDGRVAVLNTRSSHNFYHWMSDILPRLMPLRRVGIEADYFLVDCLSPFQQNVLAALGIVAASTDSTALSTALGSRTIARAFAADADMLARFGSHACRRPGCGSACAIHSPDIHQPAQNGHSHAGQ